MSTSIQTSRRLTLATVLVVALAAFAGTLLYRTYGPTQQPDVYQLAFSDQLSNCGSDAACWKLEATRMQALARYYQMHANASGDLYRQEQKQGLVMAKAFNRCAALLPSSN